MSPLCDNGGIKLCIHCLQSKHFNTIDIVRLIKLLTMIIRSVPILYKSIVMYFNVNYVGLITCKSKGFIKSIMVMAEH
jgi:hypothetical protein